MEQQKISRFVLPSHVPSVTRRVVRVRANEVQPTSTDALATEQPLEVRVGGETIAITMRTPGDDHDLALGFLSPKV